jgi:hypothetical protein
MLLEGASAHSARGLALLLAIAAQMMMTRACRIGRTLSNASLQYWASSSRSSSVCCCSTTR